MNDPLKVSSGDLTLNDEGVPEYTPQIRSVVDTVELLPLQGLLDIQNPGPRQASQLKVIHDYLAETSNGTGDLLYQFRQLENRMTAPRLGESRLSKVYNYVKMQQQIKQIEQQRDELLR